MAKTGMSQCVKGNEFQRQRNFLPRLYCTCGSSLDSKCVSSGDNICASKSTASQCQGWTSGVLLLKPFSDADDMTHSIIMIIHNDKQKKPQTKHKKPHTQFPPNLIIHYWKWSSSVKDSPCSAYLLRWCVFLLGDECSISFIIFDDNSTTSCNQGKGWDSLTLWFQISH